MCIASAISSPGSGSSTPRFGRNTVWRRFWVRAWSTTSIRTRLRPRLAGAAAPAMAGAQVVGDDVLAECPAVGQEHPAAVAPAQLVHERHQPRLVVEHEHVDRRAPPRVPRSEERRLGKEYIS